MPGTARRTQRARPSPVPSTGTSPFVQRVRAELAARRPRSARSRPRRGDRGGAAGRFEVRLQPERELIRVVPSGDVDVSTAGVLREQVHEVVGAGFEHVAIDLREVTFIDSTGLRVLLGLNADARGAGWRLALLQGPPQMRRLFEVTRTVDVLPFTSPNALRDG